VTDYVYGVLATTASAPSGNGIRDKPLRLVSGDGMAALVSDLDTAELELGREELLTHGRVLSDALEHGTVLPMRFGVVMDGDDDVRTRLLEQRAPDLRAELERLAGTVEVNIRATYDEQRVMREVLAENPSIAHLRDRVRGRPEDATYFERIELGELVSNALARKREEDAANILAALRLLALDVEVGETTHERVVLSAGFLVERARLGAFDEVLEALAEGNGGRLRFKYTGPLPPHSFVQLEREV
jgi:gas vesicle protein GvpL/GvpF